MEEWGTKGALESPGLLGVLEFPGLPGGVGWGSWCPGGH